MAAQCEWGELDSEWGELDSEWGELDSEWGELDSEHTLTRMLSSVCERLSSNDDCHNATLWYSDWYSDRLTLIHSLTDNIMIIHW